MESATSEMRRWWREHPRVHAAFWGWLGAAVVVGISQGSGRGLVAQLVLAVAVGCAMSVAALIVIKALGSRGGP